MASRLNPSRSLPGPARRAAGSAGAGSGLAYRIAESGYRLDIPRIKPLAVKLSDGSNGSDGLIYVIEGSAAYTSATRGRIRDSPATMARRSALATAVSSTLMGIR